MMGEREYLGAERKGGVKPQVTEQQAARLMMCLLTTAKGEVEEAADAEEDDLLRKGKYGEEKISDQSGVGKWV